MGNVCPCLDRPEYESNPILDQQARARAAEAAAARQAAYDNSAAGRAAKKSALAAEREKKAAAAGRGTGDGLASRWD
jgi:hypothetical protein